MKYFICATDTDAGKTYVCTKILNFYKANKKKVIGFKPIASGCVLKKNQLENKDVKQLQKASSFSLNYSDVNTYQFADPVAPHICASKENIQISLDKIKKSFDFLACKNSDLLLVEGVGGWAVPLGGNLFLKDLVNKLNLEVIFIVNIKLGCINHGILTEKNLIFDKIRIKGWIANIQKEETTSIENIKTLQKHLKSKHLLTLKPNEEITTNFLQL